MTDPAVTVTFAGSGDAFGSGGRFQTCISVKAAEHHYLLDCGASSSIALKQAGIDPDGIDTIVCSHLHGDHFGGVPFLIVEGQFVTRRSRPLTVVGPPGLRHRLDLMAGLLFPGSTRAKPAFPLKVVELEPTVRAEFGPLAVTGFPVNHYGSDCGAPPLALRSEIAGRTITYSGDTDWVDTLIEAGEGADLFICEAWFRTTRFRYHMDLAALEPQLPRIAAKRVMLTHLGPEMLNGPPDPRAASDGLAVPLP